MGDASDAQIMREIQSLRGEVTLLRDDVALMRSELGALAARDTTRFDDEGATREALRKLWKEGEGSGIAGDLDEVVDDVLTRLPPRGPSNP